LKNNQISNNAGSDKTIPNGMSKKALPILESIFKSLKKILSATAIIMGAKNKVVIQVWKGNTWLYSNL
jgi:hypothetical protein